MEIPDHLTYLLRNLYAGEKAAVIIGHGKTDWFKIGKRSSGHRAGKVQFSFKSLIKAIPKNAQATSQLH